MFDMVLYTLEKSQKKTFHIRHFLEAIREVRLSFRGKGRGGVLKSERERTKRGDVTLLTFTLQKKLLYH